MRHKLLSILCLLLISHLSFSHSEEEKVNKAILFDFFMNYEIAQKNGNLSLFIDFIPELTIDQIKSATINTDIGDEESTLEIKYNTESQITNLDYTCDGRIYKYKYQYDDEEIEYITIAGRKKIIIEYDDDIISKITRISNSATMELNFEYDDDEQNIAIKIAVIQGDRRQESKTKYNIQLDSELRIKALNFMELSTEEIVYNIDNSTSTIKFSHVNGTAKLKWEYLAKNSKGYWIKRKVGENYFNRNLSFYQ